MQREPISPIMDTCAATPFHTKLGRFGWRIVRNFSCLVPPIRNQLFPTEGLARQFGPADLVYGIGVFERHWEALAVAGFRCAKNVLEIGPGRNPATALLVWAALEAREPNADTTVTMWDVFHNMRVDAQTLRATASDLIQEDMLGALRSIGYEGEAVLRAVANGSTEPRVKYIVSSMPHFFDSQANGLKFDLVYSQAAVEHIWYIKEFWKFVSVATAQNGWHSHRIDLADHGRRATNYIEMLEWSPLAYWLTMRFVPGSINRFRASCHLAAMNTGGLQIVAAERTLRRSLPVPRSSLARLFRSMADEDLRCTALDVVARKES